MFGSEAHTLDSSPFRGLLTTHHVFSPFSYPTATGPWSVGFWKLEDEDREFLSSDNNNKAVKRQQT